MTDEQFERFINVIGAGFARMATALEAQHQEEETVTFALADFPNFDWSRIGATEVQSDEGGTTYIRAANGRMCMRRGNPKFGNDIWFSYGAGKNADGTPKYARVVEFKEIKPAEPLSRKTEQALKQTAPTQSAPQRPAQPITQHPPAQMTVAVAPTAPIKTAAPTQSAQAAKPDPTDLFAMWQHYATQLGGAGNVAPQYQLEQGDKGEDVARKTEALRKAYMVKRCEAQHGGTEATRLRVALSTHHVVLNDCITLGVTVAAQHTAIADDATAEAIEMTNTTLANLREARKRQMGASAGTSTAQAMRQATQQATPAALFTGYSPTQVLAFLEDKRNTNRGTREADPDTRTRVQDALRTVCGSEDTMRRVLQFAFEVSSFINITSAQCWALNMWLKPAKKNGAWVSGHLTIATEIAAILQWLPTEAPQPELVAA